MQPSRMAASNSPGSHLPAQHASQPARPLLTLRSAAWLQRLHGVAKVALLQALLLQRQAVQQVCRGRQIQPVLLLGTAQHILITELLCNLPCPPTPLARLNPPELVVANCPGGGTSGRPRRSLHSANSTPCTASLVLTCTPPLSAWSGVRSSSRWACGLPQQVQGTASHPISSRVVLTRPPPLKQSLHAAAHLG